MYEARTIEAAARKWQLTALWNIAHIARALGIDFNVPNTNWTEDARTAGLWHKSNERDTVQFIPAGTDRIIRKIGDARPTGELETKLAVVNTYGPNDYPSNPCPAWNLGESLNIEDSTSMVHGWSVTLTQGLEIGGEAAGVKSVSGLELGTHGEYSKGRVEGKDASIDAGSSLPFELPPGEIARAIQTVRVGPVEIDVEDKVVLRIGFKVADWRKPNNDLLKNHVGFAAKGRSKSRWHWDVPDTEDLRSLFEYENRRYPNVKRGSLEKVRWRAEWLLDEANRTIRIPSVVKAERGIWGEGKVERIG